MSHFPATVTIEEKHLDAAIATKRRLNVPDGCYLPSCHCVTAEALRDAGLLRQSGDGWGRSNGTLLGVNVVATENNKAVHLLTCDFDANNYAACREVLPLTFTVDRW